MNPFSYFRKNNATGETEPVEVEELTGETPPAKPTESAARTDDPTVLALQAKISAAEQTIAELKTRDETNRVNAAKADGIAYARSLVTSGRILPAGAQGAADLHAFASLHAAGLPTTGIDLATAMTTLETGLVKHSLTSQAVVDATTESLGLARLDNGSAGSGSEDDETAARKANDAYFSRMGVLPHTNGAAR